MKCHGLSAGLQGVQILCGVMEPIYVIRYSDTSPGGTQAPRIIRGVFPSRG